MPPTPAGARRGRIGLLARVVIIALVLIVVAMSCRKRRPPGVLDVEQGFVALPGDPSETSGIAHVEGSTYYVVDDDDCLLREYTIELNLDTGFVEATSLEADVSLESRDDCEEVAVATDGRAYVSDETEPAIIAHNPSDGAQEAALFVPTIFRNEMRNNFGFESLAIERGGGGFWSVNEGALEVDGDLSSETEGMALRLQHWDASGAPDAQYAYLAEPVPDGTTAIHTFGGIGVVDMEATDDGRILVMERTLTNLIGTEWEVYVFEIDLAGATDVTALGTLDGTAYTPVGKRLMFRANVGENFESMAIGPALANGDRSLLFLSEEGNLWPFRLTRRAVTAPRPAPGETVVIATAGDIACAPDDDDFNDGAGDNGRCQQEAVSDLLVADSSLHAVLPLGDLQYEDGDLSEFYASYAPTWGRVKAITYPVPGNHEFYGRDGSGYFTYFATGSQNGSHDPERGYYSYNLGSWHFIALNSVCEGQLDSFLRENIDCDEDAEMADWLRADLTEHADSHCTIAYWHHPRFTSSDKAGLGGAGRRDENEFWWNLLYQHGAEIVLNGHEHHYERFAPQDPAGNVDSDHGIRQFVVGTGGREADAEFDSDIEANSVARSDDTHGVLKLQLHDGWYEWEFVPTVGGGGFAETGSGTCHPPRWPPEGALFTEDFENGASTWSADSCWRFGDPDEEPTPLHETKNKVASADDCDGAGRLTSPTIDLSFAAVATLTFWHYVDDNLDDDEYLRVEVHDGLQWHEVAFWTDGNGDDDTWREFSIDVTPYKSAAFRIRFEADMNRDFEEVEVDSVAIIVD